MRYLSTDDLEPALEISIDEGASPTSVRLCGLLDHATGAVLLRVIDQLVAQGTTHVVIDTDEVEIHDTGGAQTLAICQRRVLAAGGIPVWTGLDRQAGSILSLPFQDIG